MPQRPELPLCDQRFECRFSTRGQWPDCTKDSETQLHPALAAEQLCLYALFRHIKQHHLHADTYTDFCLSWDAIECGLQLTDQSKASDFFEYAEYNFARIAREGNTPYQKVGAQLGELFLPAYRARYTLETLTARDVTGIHAGIVNILRTFDDIHDKKGTDRYGGLKTELVVLALFSRLGQFEWLAYPASPREEHSNLPQFNHDSYVILQGTKVPVQAKRKSGRSYDKSVAVVRFKDIMDRVNRQLRRRVVQQWGNKRKLTSRPNPLDYTTFTDLLVREVKGPELTEQEAWLLKIGSLAAAAEVINKYAIINNNEHVSELQAA